MSDDGEAWQDDTDTYKAADTGSEAGSEAGYEYSDGEGGFDDYFDDGSDMGEEEAEDSVAILLENTYYEADDLFSQKNYKEALEKYQTIVKLESDPQNKEAVEAMSEGPWTFKALAKIVTIHLTLGNTEALVAEYKNLLKIMNKTYVTANSREEAINETLTHPSLTDKHDENTITQLYQATLATLKSSDRLWFKTSLSQARLYLRGGHLHMISPLLKKLYRTCKGRDGHSFDKDKASDLLEVYAVEMKQLFMSKSFGRMKVLYPKTKGDDVTNAVEDSRTMGPLREYGGRMWMHFRQWTAAYNEFFESFKAYEEAGKTMQAKACIKYLVVANIIACADVNPFAAREICAYGKHPDIEAMRNLRDAFYQDEIGKFQDILRCSQNGISTDPFISGFTKEILDSMRTKVLKRRIKPYRRIRIAFLAKQCLVDGSQMQKLLERLILDEEISGTIDQIGGYYEKSSQAQSKKFTAIQKWSKQLDVLRGAINAQLS